MKKLNILVMLFLLSSTMCWAHRIDVFCYVEDKDVKCYSKFSTGTPVVQGTYKVYANDKLIFQGKGDKKGNFFFHIPENLLKDPVDIKVVCEASMGHKNYWIVRKDEYSYEKEQTANDDTEEISENLEGKIESTSVDYKKLEKIFKKVLSTELSPIKKDIAELSSPKIGLRDILGGIGYIFGFMGIILYFKSKR